MIGAIGGAIGLLAQVLAVELSQILVPAEGNIAGLRQAFCFLLNPPADKASEMSDFASSCAKVCTGR